MALRQRNGQWQDSFAAMQDAAPTTPNGVRELLALWKLQYICASSLKGRRRWNGIDKTYSSLFEAICSPAEQQSSTVQGVVRRARAVIAEFLPEVDMDAFARSVLAYVQGLHVQKQRKAEANRKKRNKEKMKRQVAKMQSSSLA